MTEVLEYVTRNGLVVRVFEGQITTAADADAVVAFLGFQKVLDFRPFSDLASELERQDVYAGPYGDAIHNWLHASTGTGTSAVIAIPEAIELSGMPDKLVIEHDNGQVGIRYLSYNALQRAERSDLVCKHIALPLPHPRSLLKASPQSYIRRQAETAESALQDVAQGIWSFLEDCRPTNVRRISLSVTPGSIPHAERSLLGFIEYLRDSGI